MFDGIGAGFEALANPETLLYVVVGCLLGMVVGVLPGFGPASAIALLLPATFDMEPVNAIVMLAGIYYGGMYGGTITAVLLRIPGEAASVMTCIDGYSMALKGRAGAALGISAIGSFIGGTFSVIMLTLLAAPLARLALIAGPPEYVILGLMGLVLAALVASGTMVRALVAVVLGLILATVGQDPISGGSRFTGGSTHLLSGIEIVALVMGLFGISEVLLNVEKELKELHAIKNIGRVYPTRAEMRTSLMPMMRGSGIGFVVGALPAGGSVLATVASYTVEKRHAQDPRRFGKGAIEGVAGPETANNAAATSAFAPLLTIGIPGSVATAIIYGALVLQGITPGPQLVAQRPDVFWGVILSMYLGNIVLLILALPLVRVFVSILHIRYALLAPIVSVLVLVGAYSTLNDDFAMWIAITAGVAGYIMRKVGIEPAPLIIAFVLGTIIEIAFLQTMTISGGSLLIFVTRPISAFLLALALVAGCFYASKLHWRGRRPDQTSQAKPSDVS